MRKLNSINKIMSDISERWNYGLILLCCASGIMNLFIWLCVTQALWPSTLGFYHLLSKKMFLPPQPLIRNDSYFGYSITHDSENKRLVISAPREDNIGVVYNCEIENRNCSRVEFEKPMDRVSLNYTHDYWFGATVKAGPDFVVMCAPRYTRKNIKLNDYGTYGQCFSQKKNLVSHLRSEKDPARLSSTQQSHHVRVESTMDSLGWSIDVASDDSVIVGGPAMNTGRVIYYKRLNLDPISIPNNDETPILNFGYSVVSGTFINDKLSYAVGSPYGHNGVGEVLFFNGIKRQGQLKTEDREVVGSMFGAVLCAAKMSGGKSDLLVGAPTYALKSAYNLGAVYIYTARRIKREPEYKKTIVGQKSGSMFGSAIINVGDLNGDGKDEVAIGAPFENNGRGAVYLYSGAELVSDKTEKTLTVLQKIEPEAQLSFGMSLTSVLDYDDNGCNELAIGAPYSDAVVLFRCMAAVTMKTSVKFPIMQNRSLSGQTEFEFQVCFSVTYPRKPENVRADISTSVEMFHSHARLTKLDKGVFKFKTSLNTKLPEYCGKVPFILPMDGDYGMKITYKVSSTLLNSPKDMTSFEGSQVVLSDQSELNVQGSVSAAECSGSMECVPKLSLTAVFSFKYEDDNRQYIIGSSKNESFVLTVHNVGDVAYDACLRVQVFGTTVLKHPTSSCEKDGDGLLCAPTKPLWTKTAWNTTNIILEMAYLTNRNRDITVNVSLHNSCQGEATKNFTFPIPLRADIEGISVKGITDIGDIVNMTSEDIQIGKQMQHVYTIMNNGPTNWEGLSVYVTLFKEPYISYKENTNTVTIHESKSNAYSDCRFVESNEKKRSFFCKIDTLKSKVEIVKIVVLMNIVPGSLDGILDDGNVTISSNILVSLDDQATIPHSILTTITLMKAIVPLWVIVVAALVGLLILVIIAFALYECGFLRRKTREDLKELQRNVKRQTIIRRSTMGTSQPNAREDDRRPVLDNTAEENEDSPSGSDVPPTKGTH